MNDGDGQTVVQTKEGLPEPESHIAVDVKHESDIITAKFSPTPAEVKNDISDAKQSQTETTDTKMQTLLEKLDTLVYLAEQLITLLAKLTLLEATSLGRTIEPKMMTPNRHEYQTLRTLFDPIQNLYRTGATFIIPGLVGLNSPSQADKLRKANQALWFCSVFSGETSMRETEQSFLFNFVAEGENISKSQGQLYLELKTQAFALAFRFGNDTKAVLAELFGSDMDPKLISRHPESPALDETEQDFMKKFSARRDALLEAMRLNKVQELVNRYDWNTFVKETLGYISKNYGTGQQASAGGGVNGVYAAQMQTSNKPTWVNEEYPQRPIESYPRLIPNNQDDWQAMLFNAFMTANGMDPAASATATDMMAGSGAAGAENPSVPNSDADVAATAPQEDSKPLPSTPKIELESDFHSESATTNGPAGNNSTLPQESDSLRQEEIQEENVQKE